MDKKLTNINLGNVKSVMQFLKQPTVEIAEALTGILASDLKDWKLSAGKIIQSIIKGDLLTQLGREIEKYREEGKIKEDYLKDNINRISFKDLLSFIDEEIPDETRFRAMKSIFLFSISKNATNKDEELAYQLMQICRQLSGGDILVLKTAYDIFGGRIAPGMPSINPDLYNRDAWFSLVAQQIGHGLPALVERYEKNLMELKLITNIKMAYGGNDTSSFEQSKYFRLTSLGKTLCEFIAKYE